MIPEIDELSFVFLGNFNPAIITPSWLELKKLINSEDYDDDIEIINPHLAKYKLEWAEVEITHNRCQFRSKDGTRFESLLDLVVGIFKVLPETPITAFGINNMMHYAVSSDQYMSIGKILAPFENWYAIMENPKMLRLEIVQEKRSDELPGSQRVRVIPSNLVKPFGVTIDINNHFEFEDSDIEYILEVLMGKFEETLKSSKDQASHVLEITKIGR